MAAPVSASAAQPFVNIPYASWSDDDPSYRLYPGDELDVVVPSAPELNKTVTVQPDGRVMVPLLEPQMAAGKTAAELEQSLSAAYSSQLLRPGVQVVVKAQPLKVFVGGEVGKPGVYDMPGDIDALRAIVQAGGFASGAKRSQVVIIRRGHDGRPMLRTVNFDHPDHSGTDLVPLRRFDVIYVPRTGLAEVGEFMTQLRNALPLQFSYATAAGISPVF
ncbi:MAG TPA: polysaccharide biosynthesis/export family protein [Caulobacteraceae bacterium]|nr:polysaccharide biosynthesis/export family protein [Caulobacteraceae bacterium]